MNRRGFGRLCLVGAATALRATGAGAAPPAGVAVALARHNRVRLTAASGEPLRAGALEAEETYLFFYPFASTPCLLLDLGRALDPVEVAVKDGSYAFPGGVGPRRSVAAFTAICPHEWSHPERLFSPIRYHKAGERAVMVGERDRLVVCCVHGSAFDPAAGGRLEQGPAEVPLALVALEWDSARDELFAYGMLGPTSFDRFFQGFRGKARAAVEGEARVARLSEHSAAVARC